MHLGRCLLILALFLEWFVFSSSSFAYRDTTHLVRSGDSLWTLSKKYGVSVNSIIRANRLANPNQLDIGQKLLIPPNQPEKIKSTSANGRTWNFKYNSHTLNKLLQVQTRKKNKWRYIVIHHSATPNGSAKAFDYFHRDKRHMKNGLAYHFVIGNGSGAQNGKIEVGNRWKKQIAGGHCSNQKMNQVGIGICLVGNFQEQDPSRRQVESLVSLVRYLQKEFDIPRSRVILHNEVKQKSTLCPGKNFSGKKFRRLL